MQVRHENVLFGDVFQIMRECSTICYIDKVIKVALYSCIYLFTYANRN